MAGQSFVAGARTAKTLGVTAVFMQRVDDAALLGNVLMHLLKSARHDCGEDSSPALLPIIAQLFFEYLQNWAVTREPATALPDLCTSRGEQTPANIPALAMEVFTR